MSLCGLKRGDIMCGPTRPEGGITSDNPFRSVSNSLGFGGLANKAQIQINSKRASEKESTPSLPKSSGDSGLSIRRSSGGKEKTPQRVRRSAAGARKRYKTT